MTKYFRIVLVVIILSSNLKLLGQTYYYYNESKPLNTKSIQKSQSVIVYTNNKIKKYDNCSNIDSCVKKIEYNYIKVNDTIFINYINAQNQSVNHPQFSLEKKDTLFFLLESEEGFLNNKTKGQTHYLKDTVIKLNKGNTFNCYVFQRMERRRDNKKRIGYVEVETICIDKEKLIPILSKTKYIDPFTLKTYSKFYENKKLFRVRK